MRRFIPALSLLALIAAGTAAIWVAPWRTLGGKSVWAVVLLVVVSKLVAIVIALHRSRAGA
jgi:hypothetical protein